METKNSPYTPKKYEHKKREIQQPSIPAGPSEYPEGIPQVTPNIPTYEYASQTQNQKKLVDLQIYEQKKPNFLADKQANIALEPLALSSPFMPPQFQSYLNNMMKNFYTPFIYKDYNINIGGPNADRMNATVLYEDILPPTDVYTSYKSLRERNNLLDYIRSTFIIHDEGEFKNFKGDGPNSLNSRLKLVELTPNNTNDFTNNPFTASPHNFLLYHSCYPIVFDKKDYSSHCSKSSTGLNLRVYNIYTGEIINLRKDHIFLIKVFGSNNFQEGKYYRTVDDLVKARQDIKYKYNSIRDIRYYEFIRNEICKKKISPNFVQSYCYFLDEDTKLSFNKNNNNKITVNKTKKFNYNFTNENDKWYEEKMEQLLLIFTESPELSIKYWCSNEFVKDRSVHRQTRIGYKSHNVWNSIIAQILLSFYVMLDKKFIITEMTLQDNFYIKDVNLYNQTNQYWIYIVNGIKYYIPNNGYLLMIDHNYHDLSNENQYKILSSNLKDNDNDINKKIYENFKKCVDIQELVNNKNNQVIIPDTVQELFNNIKDEIGKIKETEFSKQKYEKNILYKFLGNFIHNRIGTVIRDLEKININKESILPFAKGEIAIYEEKFDTYKIVMYIDIQNDSTCKCISKKDNIIEEILIDKGILYHYSGSDEIPPDNFTIDNLIETYII